jgi:hypothetical protein
MGAKWDYTISDPTSSSSYKTERYAFLWKTSKIKKIGEAWLEKNTTWKKIENPIIARLNTKASNLLSLIFT